MNEHAQYLENLSLSYSFAYEDNGDDEYDHNDCLFEYLDDELDDSDDYVPNSDVDLEKVSM